MNSRTGEASSAQNATYGTRSSRQDEPTTWEIQKVHGMSLYRLIRDRFLPANFGIRTKEGRNHTCYDATADVKEECNICEYRSRNLHWFRTHNHYVWITRDRLGPDRILVGPYHGYQSNIHSSKKRKLGKEISIARIPLTTVARIVAHPIPPDMTSRYIEGSSYSLNFSLSPSVSLCASKVFMIDMLIVKGAGESS